jgi:hypothetical protein
MPDSQTSLSTLFVEAFRTLSPKLPVPEVDVRYYPYARLHHTIRRRSGRIYVRLSDILKSAPPNVHRALAFILVSKLLRHRGAPSLYERVYRDYSFSPEVLRASDLARRENGRKLIASAQGNVYNLARMFQRLNQRYFGGELEQPTLTWSQRRTRTILGSHYDVDDTIVISKTLDSDDVPDYVVEYILYHEMLHIKHRARLINGRRHRHTKAFRSDELRFPHYHEAQRWLDQDVRERRAFRARAA